MKLPAERSGPIPPWPLPIPEPSEWETVWRLPQSVAWEGMGVEPIVARYLHLRSKVTDPIFPEGQSASFWNVLTSMEDRLGLTPTAMMKLQWEIEGRTEEYIASAADDSPSGNAAVVDLKKRASIGA